MVVDEPVTEIVARLGAGAAGRGRRAAPARAGGGLRRAATAASPCAASPVAGGSTAGPTTRPVVEKFLLDGQQARLTQASLETLAVVAYRQPISPRRASARSAGSTWTG